MPRFLMAHSKHELQGELNQARIAHLGSDLSKAAGTQSGAGRTKGRMVKQVEEFRPELQAQAVIGTEVRPLESSEVEIDDSVLPQCGVHARLASVPPLWRIRET